jgi:hypothetical protein
MMNHSRRKQSNISSSGSIWSKVSFIFRLILCVLLPMIFPESEALVTNLRFHTSSTGYELLPTSPQSDLLREGVHDFDWTSLPLRILPGKSTTAARNVELIRNRYSSADAWCCRRSQSSSSSRTHRRESMGLLPWLLVVISACYFWLRYHQWRLMLSLGFLMAHFVLQEGSWISEFSAVSVLRNVFAWYMAHLCDWNHWRLYGAMARTRSIVAPRTGERAIFRVPGSMLIR